MKLTDKLLEKVLAQFASYGIEIEKFDTVKQKLYLTVPAETDADLQGREIADFVKSTFRGTPLESFRILFKIRDEKWDRAMANEKMEKLKTSVKQILDEKGIHL